MGRFSKITKGMFLAYEGCRESGATNMFDLRTVTALTGLERKDIITITRNYKELMRIHGVAQ